MTLLFIDGFDAQDALIKWLSTLGAAPDYTGVGRYGVGTTFKAGSASGRLSKPIAASAQIIIGAAVKVDSIASARILFAGWGDSGATQHATLQVSTTGQLQAMRGNSTVVASSAAGLIVAGAANYIEMRGTIADAGGVIEVKLNGVQVINFSGDTKNAGTATNFDMVTLGSTTTDPNVSYDDLYISNALGSAPQNTFLGEVVVQTLVPNGAGASTGLTPVGSPNNWENVDEIPYSTADYNASNVPGTRDTYSMSNLAGSTGTIFGVQNNIIASKTGVGAASLKPVVRSGGTDYYDATLGLGASPVLSSVIRETDPATSAAWTATNVNAVEVGAEVA